MKDYLEVCKLLTQRNLMRMKELSMTFVGRVESSSMYI